MKKHDVVYVLKDGADTEELRYSMRSLANFPHDKVFLVGQKPEWASDKVIIIDRKQYDWHVNNARYLDSAARWMSACEDPRVSESFWFFNDDFFIMKPIQEFGYRYHVNGFPHADSTYGRRMRKTQKLLEHIVPIVHNYDLHMPMLMEKQKRIALNLTFMFAIRRGYGFSLRTLYGNLFEVGGDPTKDCKIVHEKFHKWAMLSSDRKSFNGAMGEYIRSQFPDPSEYEI